MNCLRQSVGVWGDTFSERQHNKGRDTSGESIFCTRLLRSSMFSEMEVSLCFCSCLKEYSNARIFLEFSLAENQEDNSYQLYKDTYFNR